MRCRWIKRTLFLADRTAQLTRAAAAFAAHLPQATLVNLAKDAGADGDVYLSTCPTMQDRIAHPIDTVPRFGPGHFDLVIVNIAHRGICRRHRAIFSHFDALRVGLTAMPEDEIDRDTYRLFDLETGIPTDAYDLDEAIADHHLVPPRAVCVPVRQPRGAWPTTPCPTRRKTTGMPWNGTTTATRIRRCPMPPTPACTTRTPSTR